MQADAVAVTPGDGGRRADGYGVFTLGTRPGTAPKLLKMRALERIAQDIELDLQLILSAGLLVLAAAADGKIFTMRAHALACRFKDAVELRGRKAAPVVDDVRLDQFSRQRIRDKNRLAGQTWVAVRGLVRGDVRQPGAAVDSLFDAQLHD